VTLPQHGNHLFPGTGTPMAPLDSPRSRSRRVLGGASPTLPIGNRAGTPYATTPPRMLHPDVRPPACLLARCTHLSPTSRSSARDGMHHPYSPARVRSQNPLPRRMPSPLSRAISPPTRTVTHLSHERTAITVSRPTGAALPSWPARLVTAILLVTATLLASIATLLVPLSSSPAPPPLPIHGRPTTSCHSRPSSLPHDRRPLSPPYDRPRSARARARAPSQAEAGQVKDGGHV